MAKDVIIALDFENKEKTLAFLDQFTGRKPFVKIGMELYYAEGPAIVKEIKARGHKIFLDLKLHDIPNTVKKAMKVLSHLDVDMTNLHASGTIAMMEAAKEGLTKEDGTCGVLLAVTQLTSTSEERMQQELLINATMPETVKKYAQNAKAAGLSGVVCSPLEAALVKEACGPEFMTVTPGIRFADGDIGDQVRVMTPAKAREGGSDYIVVGRPITAAADPVAAYERCIKEFLGEYRCEHKEDSLMIRLEQKDLTASFYYNGQKHYVIAGTHCFDKGLEVTLEYDQVQENAHHLLLRMRNTGCENTWQLRNIKTLDLTIPGAEQLLYHSLTGDDGAKDNFFPIDTVITDTYQAHPNGGRSSSWLGTPYFDLQWGGHSAVFAVGWTGQWLADFRIDGEGAHVQLGLEYGDFYLKPGESIRLASALVVTGDDVKSTRHAFRRIMREHYSPKAFLGDKLIMPISPQCFDRYTAGVGGGKKDPSYATENGQYRMVDAAVRIKHFNTLWLDAAWFVDGFPKGVGNYRFHEGFPNGLKPVSDYAHKHSLKFLLWFEPERVSVTSDTALLEDKLLKHVHKGMRIINLGDDQVRAWLKDKLITMIRDNGVDCYRQDFNADPLPYWLAEDEEGRQGITEIKYIMGLYDLWDTLQATFPDLLIDNCASGGRRLDLEAARRAVTLWKSDTGCSPESSERLVTSWSQNQTLALCDYLPYLGCGVWEPDAYTVRSTAMHGITCTFDYFNPELDVNQAERILAEVTEMSPYWDMDFHPLTKPTLAEDVWARFQLGDAAKGALYAFRRAKCAEAEQPVVFEAVDPARTYRLTFIDETLNRTEQDVPGQALASGIPVTIPNRRNSLIIKYQVI